MCALLAFDAIINSRGPSLVTCCDPEPLPSTATSATDTPRLSAAGAAAMVVAMPLAFQSASHGAVAFGYFNVDVDLLLLERLVFDTDGWCGAIEELASGAGAARIAGFRLGSRAALGDLMGAIHGVRYEGFLGDVYRRFPFPADPARFAQRADGAARRETALRLLRPRAEPRDIALAVDGDRGGVSLDGIRFARPWFQELVAYVWRGGWPRWADERRPAAVEHMRRVVTRSTDELFDGQRWELQLCQT